MRTLTACGLAPLFLYESFVVFSGGRFLIGLLVVIMHANYSTGWPFAQKSSGKKR